MVIELCVVQFWSEIILVISDQTRAARSFDFEIMRMISDQIALHSVQLPLLTTASLSEGYWQPAPRWRLLPWMANPGYEPPCSEEDRHPSH